MANDDKLVLGGHEFTSRFILGSGKFSVDLIKAAVDQAGAQIVTMALRRVEAGQKDNILDFIPKGVTLLPNTSSARTAEEAVRIARLSREIGCGDFIKIEVMRDSKYLLPDNAETIKATEILAKEGFIVLPYMYPDLYAARALADAGAADTIRLDGQQLFRLCGDDGHHHHLVCKRCGKTVEIESPSETWLRGISEKYGFTIERHTLEVFGLCPDCRNEARR